MRYVENLGNRPYVFTKQVMIEQAPGLIQPTKGDRSKRLFGLSAPLVKGERIAQFGSKSDQFDISPDPYLLSDDNQRA